MEATNDPHNWKFAILNLVQAIELSLKELLRREHPILIYKNIDSPKTTVDLATAINRLENKKISGISFSEFEKKKISQALRLRNKITHYEFELHELSAQSFFSELFAFLVYFHHNHFEIEIDDIIPEKCLGNILKIDINVKKLKEKADKRIEEEKIEIENIRDCPSCEEDTFIISEEEGICYLCRYKEQMLQCQHCGEWYFEWEFESFRNELDWEYEEGITTLLDDYGYNYDQWECCKNCYPKICEDIQNKRDDEYNYFMEEEYYNKSRGWDI